MANEMRASRDDVARPLNTLASLIKTKLKDAEHAAEEAMRPYWQEIGELLLEAKGQFDTSAEFYVWGQRQFGKGRDQLRRYEMAVTHETNTRRRTPSSLSEALRAAGREPRGHHGLDAREWVRPVDDIAERARREAERVRDEELTRQQEREEERKLAMRLIDIGFRVLAKELHSDRLGGSKDAMQRLNRVRDRLKAHA